MIILTMDEERKKERKKGTPLTPPLKTVIKNLEKLFCSIKFITVEFKTLSWQFVDSFFGCEMEEMTLVRLFCGS
jgi:hypothetical protein